MYEENGNDEIEPIARKNGLLPSSQDPKWLIALQRSTTGRNYYLEVNFFFLFLI